MRSVNRQYTVRNICCSYRVRRQLNLIPDKIFTLSIYYSLRIVLGYAKPNHTHQSCDFAMSPSAPVSTSLAAPHQVHSTKAGSPVYRELLNRDSRIPLTVPGDRGFGNEPASSAWALGLASSAHRITTYAPMRYDNRIDPPRRCGACPL